MKMERRKFLGQLAGACAAGVSRHLGLGVTTAVAAGGAAAAATGASAAAATGGVTASVAMSGVRLQVFEVIVRQASVGDPWKEICAGAMLVNNITEEDVEQELKRRIELGHVEKGFCACAPCREKKQKQMNELALARKAAREEAIPHSPESPCACKDCFPQVLKLHQDAVNKAREKKG